MSDQPETSTVPSVGDLAPDFTLLGAGGVPLKLSALRGQKRAVLVFYPRDMTSGCTLQLAAIGQHLDEFTALDTEPFGVNDDPADSHQQFISELDISFDLLVDEGLKVAEAYGALKPEKDRIDRTVVIIGKNGEIIYRAKGSPSPAELLEAIEGAPVGA